jgi:hypothetical protein
MLSMTSEVITVQEVSDPASYLRNVQRGYLVGSEARDV